VAETDVPAQLKAFSDPFFQRFSDWAPHTKADARAYLAAHEQARAPIDQRLTASSPRSR
jgi:hypothetical protein